MSQTEKRLLYFGIAIYVLFAIFSYSYVDLNLTLTTNKLILAYLKLLQSLGYYHRQIATMIFVVFISLMFIIYLKILYLASKNKISYKFIKYFVISSTILGILAYPLLSYDIFNYIFDARIIAHYHLSPYTHRALDFTNDDWTRFMRWTHRYSPYGPVWLAFTTIPYLLGLGKFLITLFSFKVFIGLFHVFNTILIFNILDKANSKHKHLSTILYGLNPLFVIEGVVNAHNDVLVAFLLLSTIFFFEKPIKSFMISLLGASIKYINVIFLPIIIIRIFFKNITISKSIILYLFASAGFTIFYSTIHANLPLIPTGSLQVQFQPWYLFWTLPLISLIENKIALRLSILISFFSLLRYLPYLYFGNWSEPSTIIFMQAIIAVPVGIYLIINLIPTALMAIKVRTKQSWNSARKKQNVPE